MCCWMFRRKMLLENIDIQITFHQVRVFFLLVRFICVLHRSNQQFLCTMFQIFFFLLFYIVATCRFFLCCCKQNSVSLIDNSLYMGVSCKHFWYSHKKSLWSSLYSSFCVFTFLFGSVYLSLGFWYESVKPHFWLLTNRIKSSKFRAQNKTKPNDKRKNMEDEGELKNHRFSNKIKHTHTSEYTSKIDMNGIHIQMLGKQCICIISTNFPHRVKIQTIGQ